MHSNSEQELKSETISELNRVTLICPDGNDQIEAPNKGSNWILLVEFLRACTLKPLPQSL